jgi:hypothetical protein
MNDFSITEINKKVATIKERVSGLDSGRLFYEIWALSPSTSEEYQLFYKGNNKTGKVSDKFSNEFDALLNDSGIVKIKITLKDSRKALGDMEITLRNAYSSPAPAIRPLPAAPVNTPKNPQAEFSYQHAQSQQQQPQNNALGGVDMLFGLLDPDVDETKFGLLGGIIKLREKTIEDKYEKRAQEEKLDKFIADNAILKAELTKKDSELNALQGKLDKASDKIDELEGELSEYEKLNPGRDMISGLAGAALGKAVLNISKNPKFSGLFGFLTDEETEENMPKAAHKSAAHEPVQVEAVDDSPRGKATDEMTAYIKKLDEETFVNLYNLFIVFSKNPAEINACLAYVKKEE